MPEPTSWLGLTVVSAFVGAAASIGGTLLKDFWLARTFERWKQQQAQIALHRRFRDPLTRSAQDLRARLKEIAKQRPAIYLRQAVVDLRPVMQVRNDITDEYFQRYKWLSTIYRLCAFLGWLELYRQEMTYLREDGSERSLQIEQVVKSIFGDLADGQINEAPDWPSWRDTLIFREELRAVGEALIETRGSSRTIIGYGRFVELFQAEDGSMTKI